MNEHIDVGSPDLPAPILEARELSKSFGATKALVRGALSVHPGEVVALLGENGSGKSTLVKLLAGVLRPDGGEILIGGEPARLRSPADSLRAGVVTIFQEILVAPDRTVFENLWLGNGSPALTRMTSRRDQAQAVLDALTPCIPESRHARARARSDATSGVCDRSRSAARPTRAGARRIDIDSRRDAA